MWFFSTVLFLLIVICCVAGVVNALAVRREVHARREQEYHARVWAETGEGPTWRELASALDVHGPLAAAMIDTLHRRGALSSTKEPRSLAVPPEWTPRADR